MTKFIPFALPDIGEEEIESVVETLAPDGLRLVRRPKNSNATLQSLSVETLVRWR